MTVSIDVKFSGFNEYASKLKDLIQRFDTDIVGEALEQGGEEGVRVAQDNANRLTGYMADSIDYEVIYTMYTVRLFSGADYWVHQNFGTRYIQGTHFMEKGVEAMVKKTKEILDRKLKEWAG